MELAKKPVGKQFLTIFNIWMTYFVISKIALVFPHWKISSIALFNYDLYFLIFLFALWIYLKKTYNRYIYLNIAILSILYVLGFLALFIGKIILHIILI